MPRFRASLLCTVLIALTPACSDDATTPEDRVRMVLTAIEEGARNWEPGSLLDF